MLWFISYGAIFSMVESISTIGNVGSTGFWTWSRRLRRRHALLRIATSSSASLTSLVWLSSVNYLSAVSCRIAVSKSVVSSAIFGVKSDIKSADTISARRFSSAGAVRCRQARRRGAEVKTSIVVLAHDSNRATRK